MLNFTIFSYTILIVQCVFNSLNTNEDVIVPPSKIEVPLTKINNNYYGYIIVGTPNYKEKNYQIFRVNFDTGSQHLWLMTTENCPNPDCQNVKFTPYDKSKSATYTKSQTTKEFELGYTDGTVVTGHLGWDIIQLGIGDASVRFNQIIGFASTVEGIIEDCDGIFGLGLLSKSLFPGHPDPPMWTLFKQYGIGEFGIYLSRDPSGDSAGMLVFGGHDESAIEGDLQWHDVVLVNGTFEGYKIKFDKIILQKGEFRKEIPTENMLALPDSGNNVIIGPKELFDGVKNDIIEHANFKCGKDRYTFFCHENVNVLPDLIFVMDGREYILHPEDYIWRLKSGIVCKLGIFGMDTDHIVLGQIFMQTFYSKFNIIEQAVGFARAKHH